MMLANTFVCVNENCFQDCVQTDFRKYWYGTEDAYIELIHKLCNFKLLQLSNPSEDNVRNVNPKDYYVNFYRS